MLVIADQVQQFKEVVYTIVDGFFEPREVAAMRMEMDRWMASEMPQDVSTDPATRQNLQLIPLHDRSKLFRALPFAPKVIDGVGALIGHPLVKILDQMFLKPAQSGMGTSWHTDNAYFHLSDPMAGLAMWIAVDDAKPENGTLKVIPGRFQEKFPHTRDPDSNHHIRTQIDETRAVHCELEAGSIVFFCFGTPHASGDNTSGDARAGVGIQFINRAKVEVRASQHWQQIQISGAGASAGQNEYGSRVEFAKEVARVLESGDGVTN